MPWPPVQAARCMVRQGQAARGESSAATRAVRVKRGAGGAAAPPVPRAVAAGRRATPRCERCALRRPMRQRWGRQLRATRGALRRGGPSPLGGQPASQEVRVLGRVTDPAHAAPTPLPSSSSAGCVSAPAAPQTVQRKSASASLPRPGAARCWRRALALHPPSTPARTLQRNATQLSAWTQHDWLWDTPNTSRPHTRRAELSGDRAPQRR